MSANRNSYTNEFKNKQLKKRRGKIWHSFADKTNWSSEWCEDGFKCMNKLHIGVDKVAPKSEVQGAGAKLSMLIWKKQFMNGLLTEGVAPLQSTELIFKERRWKSIKKMMIFNLSKLPIIG